MKQARTFAAFSAVAFLASAASAAPLFFGTTPQDAAAADFDGDGRTDFAAVTAIDSGVSILVQQTDGSLANGWTGAAGPSVFHPFNAPRAIEARDWNGDALPDLTVLCSGNFAFAVPPSIQTLLNRGDGTFVPLASYPVAVAPGTDLFPVHFAFGEFTGDSHIDAAVAQSRDHSVRILAGDGTGRFAAGALLALPVDADGPENVLVDDFDADGLEDILCTSPDSVEVLVQTAPGTFAPAIAVALPVSPVDLRAATAGDFDVDGLLDVALADALGRAIVLKGFAADGSWDSHSVLSDAALIEPVDIIALPWDGDWIPDLAVADLAGGGVTVFGSRGTERHAVAPQTRRLAAGDLGADMRCDLLAICQGDTLDSGNADGLAIINPNSSAGGGTVTVDGTETLGANAGLRIAGAQALAAANPTRMWTIDPDRATIREFNPSPNLNASPQSRIGRTASFGFEFGGVWFADQNNGYAIERDAPVVHRFHANNGLQSSTTLAAGPDAFGFTGLARNDDNGDLFATCGATGALMRFSSAGALLASETLSPPAWDIDWDEDRDRLVAANPGRDSVRFFTDALVEDATLAFDLASAPALIAGHGITGISKSRNLDDLFLLLDSGLIVRREMATGILKDIVTIDPAAEGSAAAYDPVNDNLLLLGADGHVLSYDRTNPSQTSIVGLLDVLDTDPEFLFGGIAFDEVAEEFLVADARRPLVARMSPNSGNLLGFVDHSATLPEMAWTGAIARDGVTGRTLLRSRFAVHDPATAATIPLPAGPSDIALRDDLLVARLAGSPDLLAVDLSVPEAEPVVLPLPAGTSDHEGLAFDGEGSLAAFDGADGSGTVQEITIELAEPSAVVDWRLLD